VNVEPPQRGALDLSQRAAPAPDPPQCGALDLPQ